MLKNRFRSLKTDNRALALLIGGIIVVAMLLIFAGFVITMIQKIAIAIAIIGVAVLALGAGAVLIKKTLKGIGGV
jgi:hypothetical protein